ALRTHATRYRYRSGGDLRVQAGRDRGAEKGTSQLAGGVRGEQHGTCARDTGGRPCRCAPARPRDPRGPGDHCRPALAPAADVPDQSLRGPASEPCGACLCRPYPTKCCFGRNRSNRKMKPTEGTSRVKMAAEAISLMKSDTNIEAIAGRYAMCSSAFCAHEVSPEFHSPAGQRCQITMLPISLMQPQVRQA